MGRLWVGGFRRIQDENPKLEACVVLYRKVAASTYVDSASPRH